MLAKKQAWLLWLLALQAFTTRGKLNTGKLTTYNIRDGVSVASIASTQQSVKMAHRCDLAQPDSAPLEWPGRFHFPASWLLVESRPQNHPSR